MTTTLIGATAVASVYHASWRDLLDVVPTCDAIICDPPYSEVTHKGHAEGAQTANNARTWAANGDHKDKAAARYAAAGKGERRKINYDPWTPEDVSAFVGAWSPRTRGWFVAMSDHVLQPAWEAALREAGRYVFSPLAFVWPGSRVRMVADGPAQWSVWITVARPKTKEGAAWRSLPGAYVLPPGAGEGGMARHEAEYVVGGKPLWLMKALARDYSNRGDLVVDPTCGGGTTLVGAISEGRRAIGGDVMLEHAQMAGRRIQVPIAASLF